MIYHPRTPREAVNLRKEHADTAVWASLKKLAVFR